MEKLLKILNELHPQVDFEEEKSLIDDGILDSFDIVSLVAELNDAFDISIGVEDLIPKNFNSAASIMELIEDKMQ